MHKRLNFDVVIIGGGLCGLFNAKKLCDLGYRVAIVELKPRIAGGASTRNEGWLHYGTYHALSNPDRNVAIEVARRCIKGYRQIRGFAPAAVEREHRGSFALLKDATLASEAISRWKEAGVKFKPIPLRELAAVEPNVVLTQVSHVFRVEDLPINTRLLSSMLLTCIKRSGGKVFFDSHIEFIDSECVAFTRGSDQRVIRLESKQTVVAAGYGGHKLVSDLNPNVKFRFHKSHLLQTSRVTNHAVFFVDSGEAATMNHGSDMVAGLNDDATDVFVPTIDTIPDKVLQLKDAVRRLYRNIDLESSNPWACIKVDAPSKIIAPRSLNIAYGELIPNVMWVLPGKMTESPVVADAITQIIFERLDNHRVMLRPCDEVAQAPMLQLEPKIMEPSPNVVFDV